MAPLGHRGGQEFGPLLLRPPQLQHLLSETTLLYIFFFYNSVLFYDLFVSRLLGGVEVQVAEGRTDWAGGEIYCHRRLCYFSCFLFLSLWSDLGFFLHILMGHFSSTPLQCISSPFLFSFASPGWETGHSCRGRRACHVLLCLGLHQNIPTEVTRATALPSNNPTVVWRKQQLFSCGQYSPATPQKVTLTLTFSPLGMIHDLS